MNINGTTASQAYANTLPIKTSASNVADAAVMTGESDKTAGKADSVSLSYSAVAAAQEELKAKTGNVSAKASEFVPGLPDEAYAIPDWMAGYYHDVTDEWVTGSPANYVDSRNSAYVASSPQDRQTYSLHLNAHIRDVYERYGLSNTAERFYELKNDSGLNEKLHQAFTESVGADPEMMAVMKRLGISLS